MCGIVAGYAEPPDRIDASVLEGMSRLLKHRGPDDHGLSLRGLGGLAHRRLSILDLSRAGRQPMCNEDGRVWISYNGEVYNHADLRAQLRRRGHTFRSSTDTEVVIHAYEEWGIECLERLNGMFAFVLLDEASRTLYAVRDRLGIKPLYYTQIGRAVFFASEQKAFLAVPGFSLQVDESALVEYLRFRFVAGNNTLWKGVQLVAPGSFVHIRNGKLTERRYWELGATGPDRLHDAQAALAELSRLLSQSVQHRLVSDVPVGVQLSGGVDSSLVSAFAAGLGGSPPEAFCVGFDEPDRDETPYARAVAQQLQMPLNTVCMSGVEFMASLEQLTWYHDDPLPHENCVCVAELARLARERVVVLLAGEGADELFGGYGRYRTFLHQINAKNRLRSRARSYLSALRGRKSRPAGESNAALAVTGFQYGPSWLTDAFPPSTIEAVLAQRTAAYEIAPGCSELERCFHYDLSTYLPCLLIRQDKMSMAASIETRVPFLDHELVEWAWRLAPELKVNTRTGKYLPKLLASRIFSPSFAYRSKMGFGPPMNKWFREREGAARIEMLRESRSLDRFWIPGKKRVTRLVEDHLRGTQDHNRALWILLALEVWARVFLDGAMPEASSPSSDRPQKAVRPVRLSTENAVRAALLPGAF